MTTFFLYDKLQQKGRVIIKKNYVFICLDGVPVLELLLNEKREALQNLSTIDWKTIQYIILDFKSIRNIKNHAIEKGFIKYHRKIMTKQIKYIQIDINQVHEIFIKNEQKKWRINEWNLFQFSEKMFFSNPREFLDYLIKKKLLSKNEMNKFEKAFDQIKKEIEIMETWKKVSK